MHLILALITILHFPTIVVTAHFLRNNDVKNVEEHRKLNWEMLVPGYTDVANDAWYSAYDDLEIPMNDTSQWADNQDKFRNGDLCYKDGVYSNSNCPTELDCSHLNSTKLGPAKLCINRVPTASGMWYVLLQKCIPKWENCDKCLCGTMSSGGSNGVCVFNADCGADDSRISIDCTNPSTVTVMGDYTFTSGTGTGTVGVGSLELQSSQVQQPASVDKVSAVPADSGSSSASTTNNVDTKASATNVDTKASATNNAAKGGSGGTAAKADTSANTKGRGRKM